MIVAIDGGVASGKSAVGRRVAETLERMYTESREQMSLLRERRPNMSAAAPASTRR